MSIKLNTGRVPFPIEFDNGDKATIYINPNDPDLGTRLIASREKISQKIDEIKFDEFSFEDGITSQINTMHDLYNLPKEEADKIEANARVISKVIEKTKQIVCEELDAAFDAKVSEVAFKYCSPFAIVDGEYFVTSFITVLGEAIQRYKEQHQSNMANKYNKYVGKHLK